LLLGALPRIVEGDIDLALRVFLNATRYADAAWL
jgi:hypothetical protein